MLVIFDRRLIDLSGLQEYFLELSMILEKDSERFCLKLTIFNIQIIMGEPYYVYHEDN